MARASAAAHAAVFRFASAPYPGRAPFTADEIAARRRRVKSVARRAFALAWRRALAEHDEYVSGKYVSGKPI
jgi:hypothetical protein